MVTTDDYKITTQGPIIQFKSGCYRWRAAKEWNELSIDLRKETSISKFKRELKRKVLEDRDNRPPEPD